MSYEPITEPFDTYPIGTEFILKRPKYTRACKVIDHLKTYNSKGELVRFRYVTEHEMLGQPVLDYDCVHTTIKKALSC